MKIFVKNEAKIEANQLQKKREEVNVISGQITTYLEDNVTKEQIAKLRRIKQPIKAVVYAFEFRKTLCSSTVDTEQLSSANEGYTASSYRIKKRNGELLVLL